MLRDNEMQKMVVAFGKKKEKEEEINRKEDVAKGISCTMGLSVR